MDRSATTIDAEQLFENACRDAHRIMDDNNGSEISWKWPGEIGAGAMSRIKLRSGLVLGLGEFQVFENITVTFEPICMPVVFHFLVPWDGKYGYSLVDKQGGLRITAPGLGGSIAYRREWQGAFKFTPDIPVRGVVIYIDPCLLSPIMDGQYDCFPAGLCDIASGNQEESFNRVFILTPAVYRAIHQVLDCPYTGVLKQFYFEAKTLELITYAMAQIMVAKKTVYDSGSVVLHPNDIKRVRSIKEILLNNLDEPPSLLELARISGTNKNKLNADFRRVFGVSVFEFLRTRRLEHARALLESKEMNVTETAFEVGYAHQQSFTRAFRSHFGTSPTDHIR